MRISIVRLPSIRAGSMLPGSRALLAVTAAGALLCACGTGDARPEADSPARAAAAERDSGTAATRAQAGDSADPDDRITGAAGVEFGTTREQLLARKGAPEYTNDDFEGAQSLGYPASLMGTQANVMFMVHPQHGMMRAAWFAPVQDVARCQYVLGMWDHGLAEKYAALQVTPARTPVTSACQAFAGGTPWMKRWTDADGRQIMLSLLPGQPAVVLTYTTPEARTWERRKVSDQL